MIELYVITSNRNFYNYIISNLKNSFVHQVYLDSDINNISRKVASDKKYLLIIDNETINFQTLSCITGRNVLKLFTSTKNINSIYLTDGFFIYRQALDEKIKFFNEINYYVGVLLKRPIVSSQSNYNKIIAIASSTGGTQAVEQVFKALKKDCPPIVLVQHMPLGFTKMFADRLNNICGIDVKEAQTNDILRIGLALIAPADFHMKIARNDKNLIVKCFKGERINGLMPAADILFESVADVCGANAVGVILTGMGSDGSEGILKMKQKGAKTIGQNKDTSIVYGMANAAKKLDAIDTELPLSAISDMMVKLAK